MTRALYTASAKIQAPPPPGHPYSVALEGSEQPGRSKVYRHWRCKDGYIGSLEDRVATVQDFFELSVKEVPGARCLGHRTYNATTKSWGPYVWQTYEEVHKRRANLGVGLSILHERVGVFGKQIPIGLWCQNRPEWQLVDLACVSQANFSVSLYETLGPETTEYIINHAGLTCVCASVSHIPTLLKLASRCPTLKLIVSVDPLTSSLDQPGESKADMLNAMAAESGIKIVDIQEAEAIGAANPRPYNVPTPDDISTINYTSGTTGPPKGVVLTHRNTVAGASVSLTLDRQTSHDICFSYLPLAHIFQRLSEGAALWSGAAIGYFHGDILGIIDDMKLLRPTSFISVPRLFNRFGASIKAATVDAPGFTGTMSRHIVSNKSASIKNPDPAKATNRHALYDRIWSSKVTANLGMDRVRTMVTGSAPIDPSLQQFLRVTFANNFFQGYGLTETYAVATAQIQGDMSAGNCGGVAICGEVCLIDVPDMEYMATDLPYPRGELCVRGHQLFKGYYKDQAETDKAMLSDGWFRTGDIASVDELGRFKIIDRRKNVLKLAQGEYISPERIGNAYTAACTYLAQAYIHGDSDKASLVAIFGIAPDIFSAFVSKVLGKQIAITDLQGLQAAGKDPKVIRAVMKDLENVARKDRFNSYEKVKAFRLLVEPFTIENELLTPTLKLKRPQTAKKYRTLIDEMYSEVEKPAQPLTAKL